MVAVSETERTLQGDLDDAKFKISEFERLDRYRVIGVMLCGEDSCIAGEAMVTVIAPDGLKVGPNTRVIFVEDAP